MHESLRKCEALALAFSLARKFFDAAGAGSDKILLVIFLPFFGDR